jgi:hypothetical protein
MAKRGSRFWAGAKENMLWLTGNQCQRLKRFRAYSQVFEFLESHIPQTCGSDWHSQNLRTLILKKQQQTKRPLPWCSSVSDLIPTTPMRHTALVRAYFFKHNARPSSTTFFSTKRGSHPPEIPGPSTSVKSFSSGSMNAPPALAASRGGTSTISSITDNQSLWDIIALQR